MVLTPAALSAAPAVAPAAAAAATSCVCADAPDGCPVTMVAGGCERCCLATLPVAAHPGEPGRVDLQRYPAHGHALATHTLDPVVPPPRDPSQALEHMI